MPAIFARKSSITARLETKACSAYSANLTRKPEWGLGFHVGFREGKPLQPKSSGVSTVRCKNVVGWLACACSSSERTAGGCAGTCKILRWIRQKAMCV